MRIHGELETKEFWQQLQVNTGAEEWNEKWKKHSRRRGFCELQVCMLGLFWECGVPKMSVLGTPSVGKGVLRYYALHSSTPHPCARPSKGQMWIESFSVFIYLFFLMRFWSMKKKWECLRMEIWIYRNWNFLNFLEFGKKYEKMNWFLNFSK